MGTNELRKRKVWQDLSGSKASKAEFDFYNVFKIVFEETNFVIRPKPKELIHTEFLLTMQ